MDAEGRKQVVILNQDGSFYAEALAKPDEDLFTIHRSTKEGNKEFLVLNPEKTPILQFFAGTESIASIQAWAKLSGNKPVLSSVEFPDLDNLRFDIRQIRKKAEKNKLAEVQDVAICDRYSEYQLSKDQGVVANIKLSGALNLEKTADPSKQLVVLPFRRLAEATSWDRKSNALSGKRFEHPQSKEKYFAYEVDSKTGQLTCPSQTGMLYLIYLLRASGKYEEAHYYLQHLSWQQPLSINDKSLLASIGESRDFSPESAALSLQVALKVS